MACKRAKSGRRTLYLYGLLPPSETRTTAELSFGLQVLEANGGQSSALIHSMERGPQGQAI